MLENLFSVLNSGQNAEVLQEFFLEVFTLDFLEVEISLQAVVELLLLREELVCDLNDWIIVPKTVRILVGTQLVRNETFKVVLNIEDELLLQKGLLQQNGLDVEDVDQVRDAEHEPDLRQLLLDDLLIEFIFNHDYL